MNQQPILPTPLEQVRALAQCFDLPIKNKKALDDKVYDKNIRMELMRSMIAEVWYEPLKCILPTTLATNMHHHLLNHFDNYLKSIVGKIAFDGISRNELLPILCTYFFPFIAYKFLEYTIPEKYQFLDISELFCYENKSVNVVLNWLDSNKVWQNYLSKLETKEEKDKIERWRRGEYLPSYQAIQLLSKDKTSEWGKIKFWLLIARTLDEVRKLESAQAIFNTFNALYHIDLELGMSGISSYLDSNLYKNITYIRMNQHNNLVESLKLFADLKLDLLSLETEKNSESKDKAYNQLVVARAIAEPNGRIAYEGQHWDWLEARWHLFSGDLEKSIEYYKKAFENSLYCMGDNLKSLIQEALVATAYFEKQYKVSQRKFLAHLKNASIVFSYELPSMDKYSEKINHKDTVSDWEIEMWAKTFHSIFSPKAYFPEVEYPYFSNAQNHVAYYGNIEKIQPDYKKPNKLIPKTGENDGRKIPQLQFFITWHDPSQGRDNFDIIKKLLESGADVNQLSTSNESALLLALDILNLEDNGLTSQDRRLFDLIVQYHHTPEIVNAKTLKQEKYPLRQAILAGRPDIVKKVLDMGAIVDNVNFSNMTPLYQAVIFLDNFRHTPEEMKNRLQTPHYWNANELEYFRREAAARPYRAAERVFYNEKIQFNKNNIFSSEEQDMLDYLTFEYILEKMNKYSSINKMEEIVCILLNAGADPNYRHDIETIKGYTPLMMAIETNNPSIFEKMLEKGGDVSLCYFDRLRHKIVSCKDIKNYWKSDKINL